MPGVPYLLYRKEFMKMSDNNNNAKTMYEAVPAAAELNKVPGFDPLKFLRRAGDSMKLDLPYQKLWFRMAHPKGISSGGMRRRSSFMMTVRRTASSLKRSRPGARESAAASSCMVRITCRKPSTASTPNYSREVHTMTIIKINGGFWGWEPIETLERLYPLFEQYTLDPIYEWYGNFVNRKPEWQRSEERQAYQGCTVISGRFLHYGNFFYIVTDEEELIQRFERLVADNKATQACGNHFDNHPG